MMRRRPHHPAHAVLQEDDHQSPTASATKGSAFHSRARCKRALVASIVGYSVFLLVSFNQGLAQGVVGTYNAVLASSATSIQSSNDTSIVVDASGLDLSNHECIPAALILFGVPKEFRCIWNRYIKYIVEANPSIKFEAHIHLYSDLHLSSFSNAKNKEMNITIQSPSAVRSIIDGSYEKAKDDNNNTTKIPTRLVTSSQKEYDDKNLSWVQQRDADQLNSGISTVSTLKNIFRQGNSMYEAYLSATSKPFFRNAAAASTASSSSNNNKTFIFLRSDTLLLQPITIPCMGLATNEIHIPGWQTDSFPEYNDRTAIAGPIAAHAYARAKSHIFPQLFLDRRNKRGKEKIQWASRQSMSSYEGGTLYNPERMLMVYLNHVVENGTKISVKEREVTWAQLIRVRSGGSLADLDVDRWKTPKHLNQSNYCT